MQEAVQFNGCTLKPRCASYEAARPATKNRVSFIRYKLAQPYGFSPPLGGAPRKWLRWTRALPHRWSNRASQVRWMLFRVDSNWPLRAFSDIKFVQRLAIDTTKDLAHEVDGSRCHEIRAVDIHAGNGGWEKTRTIDVPDVVGGGRASNERWPMCKTRASQAAGTKVFKTS